MMSNKWMIALSALVLVGVTALAGCAEPGPQEAGDGNETTQNQTPTDDNQTNATADENNQSGFDPLNPAGNDTNNTGNQSDGSLLG